MIGELFRLFTAGIIVCAGWPSHSETVSFLPHRDISIGAGCCALVAGDFNGDSIPDLVVGYGIGALAFLAGDGTGNFKSPVNISVTGEINFLLAADLNRDGKLDLIAGSGTLSGVPGAVQTYVLLGRGDGTFQPPTHAVGPGPPLFVADLNGDGIPDLGIGIFSGGCDLRSNSEMGTGHFRNPSAL